MRKYFLLCLCFLLVSFTSCRMEPTITVIRGDGAESQESLSDPDGIAISVALRGEYDRGECWDISFTGEDGSTLSCDRAEALSRLAKESGAVLDLHYFGDSGKGESRLLRTIRLAAQSQDGSYDWLMADGFDLLQLASENFLHPLSEENGIALEEPLWDCACAEAFFPQQTPLFADCAILSSGSRATQVIFCNQEVFQSLGDVADPMELALNGKWTPEAMLEMAEQATEREWIGLYTRRESITALLGASGYLPQDVRNRPEGLLKLWDFLTEAASKAVIYHGPSDDREVMAPADLLSRSKALFVSGFLGQAPALRQATGENAFVILPFPSVDGKCRSSLYAPGLSFAALPDCGGDVQESGRILQILCRIYGEEVLPSWEQSLFGTMSNSAEKALIKKILASRVWDAMALEPEGKETADMISAAWSSRASLPFLQSS